MFRIHDILGWILLFSSLTFKMPAKKLIFNKKFSAYYFLKVHLHHFSKIKSLKDSRCRALKPAGRPLPHCRGGAGLPPATRRLRGGGAVVDSKNIVCHVNKFYVLCLRYLLLQYNFHQLLQVLLHTSCVHILSTATFSRPFSYSEVSILHLHSSTSLFYAYNHLWVYSGLYSARRL
jgi:hypothetical protein